MSASPTNRLAEESSLYLRQHMANPVDWYPWGPEALAVARELDKPLLVSIGYSACHWCHVMERESFEDPETAAVMNERFVCIKVDREERPDVDQIYMDAVTRIVGRGGWPLTVFCKPSGEPFYGGTYFPPEARHGLPAFRDLLVNVHDAYRSRRDEVDQSADQLLDAIDRRVTGVADSLPGSATAVQAARRLMQGADRTHGGFGGAPKFPTPTSLELLLCAADALDGDEARAVVEHVAFTCLCMARGGVYDHVGGGFHRYAVDGHWGVPHFEKMLYDEGQLLSVYAETWRRVDRQGDNLVWPIRETVAFLQRALRAPDGGFYASLDADSEGVEGRYYVWTPAQTRQVLEERAAAFDAEFGVTEQGNFEDGASVLHVVGDEPRGRFESEREALLRAREARIAPGTDTKRLAAWNGLLISGLSRAASVLEAPDLVELAVETADFVLRRMVDERDRLQRTYDGGRARVPAFLDDVAGMLVGCLDLHRAAGDERFLAAALRLADDVAERFFDVGEGDLFLTPSDGERLVHRPRSDHDGATPDSMGLATLGLVRVAALCGRRDLSDVVDRVLRTHAFVLERAPEAFPTLTRAAFLHERGPAVAVIVGAADDDATRALADCARRTLRPDDAVVVATPDSAPASIDPHWLEDRTARDGRATAYVCRGVECSAPVSSPDDLAALC